MTDYPTILLELNSNLQTLREREAKYGAGNAPIDAETLTAARERLAALPLDGIPPVATLPSGSRLPYAANPHFVGRETELRELARLLKGHQTAAIGQIAAATGLGGIGKSQLAVAFAHRYGQYFAGGVHWLSMADPAAIPAEIATCAPPGSEGLELETRVRRVLSDWQSDLPRLLIFDNCEDESLLAHWRPPTGQSRVLVTSRRHHWSATLGVRALPLATLPRAQSIELLLKFRPDLTPAQSPPGRGRGQNLTPNSKLLTSDPLDAIAAELGDLPLALHLAGSFLARYRRVTPADYLAQLQATNPLEHPAMQGRGADYSPTDHELHVAKTFALSFERLTPAPSTALRAGETDVLARQLLARAACFAPGEPIPTDLLLATLETPETEAENHSSLDLDDALRRLTDLGLLTTAADDTLTLHRLLAAFVQQTDPDPATQPAVEQAVLAELSTRLDQASYITSLADIEIHVRTVTNTAQPRVDESAANLCGWLAYYLEQIGDYAGALPYYERALVISEQVLGPEHPDTASSLNNLGALLDSLGDYKAARPYYERALAIFEKKLGVDHPNSRIVRGNLQTVLNKLNQGPNP